jgi:hypothetical protein
VSAGKEVEQAVIFHVADGKVTELWSLPTDRDIADAFARGEPVPEHRYLEVFHVAEDTRERNTFEPQDLENIPPSSGRTSSGTAPGTSRASRAATT